MSKLNLNILLFSIKVFVLTVIQLTNPLNALLIQNPWLLIFFGDSQSLVIANP